MLVSFLVPVYNVEKYLENCIESLLRQTGCPFEIVLVDDGSTDASGSICDNYGEAYPDIIHVIHKDNEGLLLTRRKAFREAKGDWFICVDSDDYVAPDLLCQVITAIKKHDCDMVMYNYSYVDDQGNLSPSRLKLKDEMVYTERNKLEIYAARLLTTDINNMCFRAIRRDILDMDTDYSGCGIRNMCEDAIQVLPLYTNAYKIVFLDQPLYYYRKAQGSITSKTSLENWKAINKSFAITERYLDIWAIPRELRERFYTMQAEVICNCARWIFHNSSEMRNYSYEEALRRLKEDSLFSVCKDNFHKEYCSTKYLKISVPVILRYMDRLEIKKLKRFFLLEDKLRRAGNRY